MDISKLNNYNSSPDEAFEALSTQLFQRWLYRAFPNDVSYFSVVNGAGGDGGVEAYAILSDGSVTGLQAKYFLSSVNIGQRNQIENSIRTAKVVRPKLTRYIICFPRKRFSKKRGKDGKIIEGDEETRLKSLLAQIRNDFPDLQVELWFEDRLLTELTQAGNEGIKRYWFDKEEISIETLRLRFTLAKAGWLNERYVPNLHHTGKIASYINELLCTSNFVEQKCADIREVSRDLQLACDLIFNFSALNFIQLLINARLLKLRDVLIKHIQLLETLVEDLEQQVYPPCIAIPEEVEIWQLIQDIEQLPKINILRNLFPKVIAALNRVHQIHLGKYFEDLKQSFTPHNYSILGAVGTGKTHALANAVESRLTEGIGALIIRAKGTDCQSWGSILRQHLDCCHGWSDEEIFRGLEALAFRKSLEDAKGKKRGENFLNKMSRILICIDGIDEADDWPAWRTRLLEAKQWISRIPFVRFIATARSYPPQSMNPCDLPDNDFNQIRIDLPEYGDYLLRDLVPVYLKAYDISFDPNSWILDAFENALTLRLFCEIHKGKNVSSFSATPANFSLGSLLKIKIARLETELLIKFPGKFAADEQIILRILTFAAEEFTTLAQIEKEDLRSRIFQEMSDLLDKSIIGQLMLMLADHGFFQVQHIPSHDELTPDRKLYGIGIESYMEYLLAIKYAKLIASKSIKALPRLLLDPSNEYIRTLAAIILFNDYGILVGRDNYWTNELDELKLMRLQFTVMKSSPDELVISQLEHIKTKFIGSYVERDLVVNEFILPNIHRKKLRLGLDFIHETLISYPNTYERDLFWSSPDHHDYTENSHLSLYLDRQRVYFFDSYDETPLVMAWSLTTINKKYRAYCRSQLSDWATYNLDGFIQLLNLLFNCGDPQIQEDLTTVIRGIASKLNKPEPKTRLLVEWILKEVFSSEVIINLSNSVVRYSAFSFIQRAHMLGICTKEELQQCSPPYLITERLLELNLNPHPLDTVQYGRFPIQDDLDWNLIDNSYSMFLPYEKGGLDAVGEIFIAPYELKYGVNLNQKQFAVAAAIAFIRKLGWNKEIGPARDGSVDWATFEEKYTHLAVHEIQGFLADRVSYSGYGKEYRLKDYSKLLHISNPADHDVSLRYHYYHTDALKWFLPEEIAEPLLFESKASLKQIREWTTHKFIPNFKKWIYSTGLQLHGNYSCKDDWVTLYCSTSFPEPNGIGRARLRIAAILIDQDDLESFKLILSDPDVRIDSNEISPAELRTSISGGIYHSVTDVVLMGKEEDDPEKWIAAQKASFEVYATVAEVHESKEGVDGDILNIPALLLRSGLDIRTTDGRGFFNASETLVACNYRNFENSNTQQDLTLIDKASFEQFLSKKKLAVVWFAENFRSTISESKCKAKNDHWQNCTKWVFWSDMVKPVELHNGEHC